MDRPVVCLQFNFVGRILGPRGMTAKQLEQETGCKIMVRGKGSMRDKKKVSSLAGATRLHMFILISRVTIEFTRIIGTIFLRLPFEKKPRLVEETISSRACARENYLKANYFINRGKAQLVR